MVRIHGNYCGPNWTAGQARPAADIDKLPYVAPTDELDAACLKHDRACSSNGCTKKADLQLRNTAIILAARNPQLRQKALLIAAAMQAVAPRRER